MSVLKVDNIVLQTLTKIISKTRSTKSVTTITQTVIIVRKTTQMNSLHDRVVEACNANSTLIFTLEDTGDLSEELSKLTISTCIILPQIIYCLFL